MAAAVPSPSSTTSRPPRPTAPSASASVDDLDMSVLSFGGGGGGNGSSSIDGSSGGREQRERRRSSLGGVNEAERAQAVKDYGVMVEYRLLKRQVPSGIYVLPSKHSLRVWHGVVFVRRALYQMGIFKFRLELPPAYNDTGARPSVHFIAPIPYHPLIHPKTGQLDVAGAYPEWDPNSHYILTVLTFVKKVFYMKEQDLEPILVGRAPALNPEAAKLLRSDRPEYERRVALSVAQSQEAVYAPLAPDSSLRFVEPTPEHEELLAALKAAHTNSQAAARQSQQPQSSQEATHPPPMIPRRLPTLEILRGMKEKQQEEQDTAAAAVATEAAAATAVSSSSSPRLSLLGGWFGGGGGGGGGKGS